MKKFFLLFLSISMFSCIEDSNEATVNNSSIENNEEIDLESDELFKFENTNFPISTELGTVQEIQTATLEEFLTSNYEDLQNMEDDLVIRMAIREDITRFYIISIDDIPNDFKTHADPSGFWGDDETTIASGCKTCTSPQCIADILNKATNGDRVSADVSFRTLNNATGVKICFTKELTLQLEEL